MKYFVCYVNKINGYIDVHGDVLVTRKGPLLDSDDIENLREWVNQKSVNHFKQTHKSFKVESSCVTFTSVTELSNHWVAMDEC
jgi:hypothetical protein